MEPAITAKIKEEISKIFEITYKEGQYELKINKNFNEDKVTLNISSKEDNILKYEEKYTLNDLININENFKNFYTINDLINSFGILIENKKIFIEKNENDISTINLVFLLYNIIGKESKAILKLKLNKISQKEYNKMLLEIANLEKKITEKDEEIRKIKLNNIKCNEKINKLEKKIDIIKKTIEKNDLNNFKDYISLNIKSSILNDISNFELLYKRLNPFNKKISFNLIYKLNKNNNSVGKFHECCDGIKNVLVLIRTTKNVRFGGYTSVGFDSFSNYKYDNSAFVFSFDKKKIYNIKKGKYAISCNKYYGPCFIGSNNGEGFFNIYIGGDFYLDFQNTGDYYNNSYNIKSDYELNNGEKDFKINKLEIFQIFIS